jgi:hypothetical protein
MNFFIEVLFDVFVVTEVGGYVIPVLIWPLSSSAF